MQEAYSEAIQSQSYNIYVIPISLYSASHSAHQSETLSVRETQSEEAHAVIDATQCSVIQCNVM